MKKFVWNKVTNCRVPWNQRLDVDGNPDLEWRSEETEEISAPKSAPVESSGDDEGLGMSVQEAIAKLNPDDKAHFTAGPDPKPNAKVLSEYVGRNVSAAERDKEWVTFKAGSDYQKGQEV